MQKSNLKLVAGDEAPPRSAERAELAEAIDKHTGLTRRLAAIDAAQATARTEYQSANAAVAAATAGVEKAKADAGQHLTAVALGEAGAAPKSVREARAEALEAEDTLAACVAARTALAEQRREIVDSLSTAKLSLDSAVWKVIATDPATRALIATFKEKLCDLTDLRRALEFLEGRLPLDMRSWRSAEEWPELPGAAPWRGALECLKQDADSPLPVS